MKTSSRIVTVFGSSRPKPGDPEYAVAYELGRELAKANFRVCNGGYAGTMEAAARGAKESGGSTIGIITSFFQESKANAWIDEVIVAPTLVERLMKLLAMGDAYMILKGGTGTLLELAAVWEFMNKGIIQRKPIIVLGAFWNGVVNTLKDELAWEGLVDCTQFVEMVGSPSAAAALLQKKL